MSVVKLRACVSARIGFVRDGAAQKRAQRLPAAPRLVYQQAIGRDAVLDRPIVVLVDLDGVRLAAAAQLNSVGHQVSVFEAADRVGKLLG